jgi:predicted Zn-dependent protease
VNGVAPGIPAQHDALFVVVTMSALLRLFARSALVFLLTIIPVRAQDLPPALAARFSQGVADLKAGQLDAAEQAFRDVVRAGGERAFVRHNLGLVLRERGHLVEALGEFRSATRLDPSFAPARLLAGTTLLTLGRVREARTELERAVRLMPRETIAHLQLAEACRRLDDPPCVADAYGQLVQLAPDDAEYAYRLGTAYLTLSRWAHDRIRAIDPGSARLDQALGREYLAQGRPDLALRALQRAALIDSKLPEIHLALARIHFGERRWDEAAGEVELELALVPSSKEALELKTRIDAARRP